MKKSMRALLLLACGQVCWSQGTVPTFDFARGGSVQTLLGNAPAKGGTTTLDTVLVPITLVFGQTGAPAKGSEVRTGVFDARPDVRDVLRSPIFSSFGFPTGGRTQYADALLRSTFPGNAGWHTMLGKPSVRPVRITVPAGFGYVLHSKRTGGQLAVADADFVQAQLFQQIGPQPGRLVVAMVEDTTFYAAGDATICCTWGTHGIDPVTGDSFVLGTYMRHAPAIVEDHDVQPLTEQLAELVEDPRHNPQHYGFNVTTPGNAVPAWMRPNNPGDCGGTGVATSYFLLEPTDNNLKNNIPSSAGYRAAESGAATGSGKGNSTTYHLQNVALLPWYLGAGVGSAGSSAGGAADGLGTTFSFPDAGALPVAAMPCAGSETVLPAAVQSPADATASREGGSGHRLIGYWTGNGGAGAVFPLRDVSAQWDVVIVAFAVPTADLPEGTLLFRLPKGVDADSLKADIALLKSRGKKVMLSLGGGGQFFKLDDPASTPNFVRSVTDIVETYGFDGVDIDFESPSLVLRPGDVDFTRPTTPSVVNLIAGLRQLREHFGKDFMISLVPEGPQMPAGFVRYGGQFGSFLPLTYGLGDILTFVDVQDYNTPPLEGLDGEIYQSHTVDYHAALTELLLQGFDVGGDPKHHFPALPASKVAVGFLTDYETPAVATAAMAYLTTGKAPAGTHYRLHRPGGYPELLGAMFWTIDDDRLRGGAFSDVLGPLLHRDSGGSGASGTTGGQAAP